MPCTRVAGHGPWLGFSTDSCVEPPSPGSLGGGRGTAPGPWETPAVEEPGPDGKVSAAKRDGSEWVSEGH